MCGGNGFKEEEATDTLRLRIYWDRKDWIRVAGNIVVDDASVMVIGYMVDLPKLKQAIEVILASANNEGVYRAVLVGEAFPHGFGRDRYFMAFMKGA
jgi:hypothetical protein